MSNLSEDPAKWLAMQFEYEYCAECGGDAEHHEAVPVMGNWFALCKHPPKVTDDGVEWHPIIQEFRTQADLPAAGGPVEG